MNSYYYNQDANGNPYIYLCYTTLDPGQTYSVVKAGTQSIDNYGNVTQVVNYAYGTPGSGSNGPWVRIYNYTYLNSSTYTSRYIYNRLTQATVTDANNHNYTLATNSYDSYSCFGSCTPAGQYIVNAPREWDSSYASVSARGNLTSSNTPSTNTAYNSYDETGNVMSATVNGVTTQVSTAASNNYAAPIQMTVGSLASTMTWNSFLGLTNATDPAGASTSLYYDQYARQSSTTSPFGSSVGNSYSNFTNPPTNGQTVTTTTTDGGNPLPPSSGRWTKKTLDGLGRTILTQSANSSGTVYSQAESVYGPCACSPNGKLMKQAMPHSTSDQPKYTVYTYDGIGRTVSVLSPDGASTTTYSYQGNQVTVTDPAGKWKMFTMDALGNLTQVVEPDPANPTGSTYTTTYTYDIWNNLATVSMPRPTGTQTRTFTYNGPYLQSATNPENGTVSYTYNSYNKVATKADAKGQVIKYTYDTYARLTEVQRYPQGTNNPEDTTQRETYYYDSNPFDSNYSQYVSGRLAAVQYNGPDGYGTNGGTTYTEMYTYSQAGAKVGKRLRIQRTYPYYWYQNGNGPLQSANTTQYVDLNGTYTYDSEGRMIGLTYPMNGPSLSWAFDSYGRLNTMGDSGGSTDIVSAATYGPSNELNSITGATNESRTYNSMLQLTQVTSGSSVNISYGYSATQNNGKIISQTDNISGEQVQYTYDSLNRLATAEATSQSWGQSYSYDGFSTLTAQNVIAGSAPTYSATPNPSTNRISCTDANGNANESAACDYGFGGNVFDVENRFIATNIQYLLRSGGFEYSYAPGNKRVWRGVCCSADYNGMTTMSTDEVTYWSVSGQKLATYQIGGYGTFVSFPPTAPPLTTTQTGTWYYFGSKMIKNAGGYVATDRLGSIGHFYPYGQEKPSATTNGTEKFTGYLRDGETGMDYADQRYHVPGTGRFLTPDPVSSGASPNNPGSWNRYAYVTGDPINSVDRTGSHGCFVDDNCDIDDSGGYGGCWVDNLVENPECENPGPALSCDAGEHYDSTQQQCVSNVQQQPPPCLDDIQIYDRPVNVRGAGLVGATHSYLDITSDSTGGLLDTIEGLPNTAVTPGQTMLVANVDTPSGCVAPAQSCEHTPGGNGTAANSLGGSSAFGPQLTVSCATANMIVSDAESFKPVPYKAFAGFLGGSGANSNTFMSWLLAVSGLAPYYTGAPPGSYGWYNSPGGGN